MGRRTSAASSTSSTTASDALTFVANYQACSARRFRRFDPNQGNYILAGNVSARTRGVRSRGGVFYHQSRHLRDRPKRQPIDWNMLGGRVRKAFKYREADALMRVAICAACS